MTTPWRATVLTLFPEVFPGPLGASLAGRGLRDGLWRLDALDMRPFGIGRHRSVDDTPFGGGAGMVLRPDVVDAACAVALAEAPGRPLVGPHPPRRAADASGRARPRRRPRRRAALRPVRRRGSARGRGARDARDLGRRLRPVRRRDGRHGPARRLRAPPARRHGGAESADEESFAGRRPAGVPALHPPGRMERPPRAGGAAVRPPRRRRRWRRAEAERATRERRPDLVGAPRPAIATAAASGRAPPLAARPDAA
jgi:tRNA (guanine37-N1)-methyltransferase